MTLASPKISVIVPTYNCMKYLPQTIESILAQKHQNIEIIIVNDGSTDDTSEYLETLADKVVVVNKKNEGVSAARNTGIKASTGEYLAFLDCDDYWLPGKLDLQLKYLNDHPDVGVVYGDFHRWNEDVDGDFSDPASYGRVKNEVNIDSAFSGNIYNLLLNESYIHIITTLCRREVIEKVGWFREDLTMGEDYNFWLRTSRISRIDKIRQPLALYRIHAESVTKKPATINYELKVIRDAVEQWGCDKTNTQISAKGLRKRFGALSFDHGYSHYHIGNRCIAYSSFKESLVYTFSLKTLAYTLMSKLSCRKSI